MLTATVAIAELVHCQDMYSTGDPHDVLWYRDPEELPLRYSGRAHLRKWAVEIRVQIPRLYVRSQGSRVKMWD